jgi:cobalt/nickel transport system permease protein
LRLTITDAGLILFATVVIKSWLSVMVSGLLVATTRFTDLLHALRALRVPAVLAHTISFMLRYLYVLVDEAMRLMTARESRSAGRGGTVAWRARVLGGMIGSLFIRSYARSERICASMVSRGFAGEMRTLTPLAWQPRDTWTALVWALVLTGLVIVGRLG